MKNRVWVGMLMALALCVGVLFSPVTAHAATEQDTTPPKLTAELAGETLAVSATDDISGVQGIYVDGKRISTLVNGAATVSIKGYHGNSKDISVYAMDNAGNKSEPVKFANPLYDPAAPPSVPPASSSAAPTPAPLPVANSSSQAPAASSSSSNAVASSSSSQSTASSSSEGPSPSTEPTVTAIPSDGDAFTPAGQGEVQDTATEESKDFYTVTTPDGYVYYLVIDHAREGDNVYFLNAVTEADLMGLAGSATVPGQSAIPEPEPEPEPDNSEPASEPDSSAPASEGGGFGTILFVLLAVAAIGGAGWYFKIYKPKQQAAMDDEDDFDGEDGEWDEADTQPDDYDYTAEEAYQSNGDAEYENEEADILEQ